MFEVPPPLNMSHSLIYGIGTRTNVSVPVVLGGVGLRWPRGRLLLHYQQALDGLKATDGALMATVSIRVL